MSTVVAADPASCRDTADDLRKVRRRADRAEDHGRERSRHFASAAASGEIALALSSACEVVSGAGRRLSDDADTAETALRRFADGIEEVEQAMEQAWQTALARGLQSSLYRDIVLPADPTEGQVLAWNDAVGTVNRLRERELTLSQALIDALSTITPEQLRRPPGLDPAQPLPVPGTGGSGGGSGSGSGGGASGGGGSAHGGGGKSWEPAGAGPSGPGSGGGKSWEPAGAGVGSAHAELVGVPQATLHETPDVRGELMLGQQVRDQEAHLEQLQAQLAQATDPAAQEALAAELAAGEQQLVETREQLAQLQQRNDEIEAANQAAQQAAQHGQHGQHGAQLVGQLVGQPVGQLGPTFEAAPLSAGPEFEPVPDAYAWPIPGPR
ncbi:hypothetical protein GGQ24_05550 [Nocardioides sp. zg-578]|nr:hypothetical protein [Nocardioides marmotae]